MAKIGTKDKKTIQAIHDISTKYPYAASLLAYTIIERILKEYIIKNRRDSSLLDYSYCKCTPSGAISLQNYYRYKKEDFIKKFIKKIALGDAQQIVIKNKRANKDYATNRNDLIHSNSYILEEKKQKRANRMAINKQKYRKSIDHLKFVINNFSDFKIEVIGDTISVIK